MNLELNFIGLSVFEFRRCYEFYAGVLGLDTETNLEANWALLGQSWDMHRMSEHPGMVIEMFQTDVRPPGNRVWGDGQNVRPAIQVKDLASAINMMRDKGVTFTSNIRELPWGEFAEILTPEDIRWTLARLDGSPYTRDFRYPYVGLVEMMVNDFNAQREFYVDVMGLDVKEESDNRILLEQKKTGVLLSLERGSKQHSYSARHKGSPVLSRPVWISFKTPDVEAIARELKRSGVRIVRDIQFHPAWCGTDIVISDPDGNPLNIAQYTPYSSASKENPFFGYNNG